MNPAPPKMHYVYLLKSLKPSFINWIYVGCTSDLKKRLQQHYEAKSYATKKFLPIKLIYYEAYLSKEDAYERESKLKHYGSALQKLKKRSARSLMEGLGE